MVNPDFNWIVQEIDVIENGQMSFGFDHVDMPDLSTFGNTKDVFHCKINLGKTRPEGQVSQSVQLKEIENDGKGVMVKQHLRKLQENPASLLHVPVQKFEENVVNVSKEMKAEDKNSCCVDAILQNIAQFLNGKNDANISLKILEVNFIQGERQWLIQCFSVYIPSLNIVLVPSPVLSSSFGERGAMLVESSLWINFFSRLCQHTKIILILLILFGLIRGAGSVESKNSNPVDSTLEISVVGPVMVGKDVSLYCKCTGDCKGNRKWTGGQDNADLTTNGHVIEEGIVLLENSADRYSIKIVNATGKYIDIPFTCFFGLVSKDITLDVHDVQMVVSSTVTSTSKKSGLSGGTIAGIAVGVVAAIAVAVFIIYIVVFGSPYRKKSSPGSQYLGALVQ